MKNTVSATIFLLVIAGGSLLGQMRSQPLPVPLADQISSLGGTSILDPARFSMQHGFSFSMQTGGFGGGLGLGIYTNSMNYLISDALSISTQFHFVQPTMGTQSGNPGEDVSVYYQTALNWQMTDNINFKIGLSNMPRYGRYNRGYNPYSGLNRSQTLFQRESVLD